MPRQADLGVSVAILNDKNRMLIGKRAPNLERGPNVWALPGGYVDEGETLRQAVDREVYEETGMQVLVAKKAVEEVPLCFVTDQSPTQNCITFWFTAVSLDQPILREPHKCQEWRWVNWRELKDLVYANATDVQLRWLPMGAFILHLPTQYTVGG